MATLTIRNLPEGLIERLRERAKAANHSMEQEVRELLESRYPAKSEVIEAIRSSWDELPETSHKEMDCWRDDEIEKTLGDLTDVDIIIYEPTARYQNVAKRQGVEKLTPPRAMIAELVRRYWVLGMECSLLEIQKLAWFLNRMIDAQNLKNPLNLHFKAHNYGPYADELRHLLNGLDGSYLKSDKRIADSDPFDVIIFNDKRRDIIDAYLHSEAKYFLPALEKTAELINGFESPFGMELLSSVDWLIHKEGVEPEQEAILNALGQWPAGEHWAQRKIKLFDARSIGIALEHLNNVPITPDN